MNQIPVMRQQCYETQVIFRPYAACSDCKLKSFKWNESASARKQSTFTVHVVWRWHHHVSPQGVNRAFVAQALSIRGGRTNCESFPARRIGANQSPEFDCLFVNHIHANASQYTDSSIFILKLDGNRRAVHNPDYILSQSVTKGAFNCNAFILPLAPQKFNPFHNANRLQSGLPRWFDRLLPGVVWLVLSWKCSSGVSIY